MEQLVVRLGSGPSDPISWIVYSTQENEIIASGELANAQDLSSLSERAGQRPITALVPTSDVLLKWVSLPAKAGRKALAAIPYMLEDEISSDINEQFFALGPKKGNKQAVAIVSREKLQSWLLCIEQAGLTCDKLIPDVLALPQARQGWALVELSGQLLIRQDQWNGLQGEKSWLVQAINHYAKQQTDPLNLENYSGEELAELSHVDLEKMPLELPMKVLAIGAGNVKFNLLQGDFKTKKQANGDWKKWRLAAALATLALLTTLIDKSIEQNHLSAKRVQLSAQIKAEYKRAFPNAGAFRDVRKTMRSKMAALEQGGGGASMLLMLSQLSSAFSDSQVKPQTLRFDASRSELRMQAVANNYEALEQFKKLAEAQGFEVEQGAINNKDSQVIGSLSIRS
jgi:general secretion pathway protein L